MSALAAGGLFAYFNYWVYVSLMLIGLYTVMAKPNLLKKVMGLTLFQTGIFVFYISMGIVDGATPPYTWSLEDRLRHALPGLDVSPERAQAALAAGDADAARAALEPLSQADRAALDEVLARPYTSPLPHVLILTAIVVSVSTMAVALAIIILIKRAYGTVEADEIVRMELEAARVERS